MNFRHKLKRNKFGVSPKEKRTTDGITFDSQLEMRVYLRLKAQQDQGLILFMLRQVPFHLPGTRYVLDFLVFYTDGRIEFIDAKGMETPAFKIKKKQVELLYPVTLTLVTK